MMNPLTETTIQTSGCPVSSLRNSSLLPTGTLRATCGLSLVGQLIVLIAVVFAGSTAFADSSGRSVQVVLFPKEGVILRDVSFKELDLPNNYDVTDFKFTKALHEWARKPAPSPYCSTAFITGAHDTSRGTVQVAAIRRCTRAQDAPLAQLEDLKNMNLQYAGHFWARRHAGTARTKIVTAMPTWKFAGSGSDRVSGMLLFHETLFGADAKILTISIQRDELPKVTGKQNEYLRLAQRANQWLKESEYKKEYAAAYVIPPVPGIKSMYYNIFNVASKRYLGEDNGHGEMKPHNPSEYSVFMLWRFEYLPDGFVTLVGKHLSEKHNTKYVLDANKDGDEVSVSHKWKSTNPYQHWKPELQQDGSWRLRQKATGRYLTTTNKDQNTKMETVSSGNASSVRTSFVPLAAVHGWTLKDDQVTYLDSKLPERFETVDVFDEGTVKNNTDAAQTTGIKPTLKSTKTFTWGLSQSISLSSTVTIKASVPELVSAKQENKLEVTFSAHQTWQHTEERGFEIAQNIVIPPRSIVEWQGEIDFSEDHEIPFILTVWVSGRANTVDGKDRPLSADQIESLIFADGFTGEVVDRKTNQVQISLTGVKKGTFGSKEILNIKQKKIPGTR